MVINIVTIVEAVAVFQLLTSGSIVFEHVKVACSMMVCNLLVIVTFVYRILHKGEMGIEDSIPDTSKVEFTTIDLAIGGHSHETSMGRSLAAPSETTNSSTWSFPHNQSKASGSVAAAPSRIYVEWEEERK